MLRPREVFVKERMQSREDAGIIHGDNQGAMITSDNRLDRRIEDEIHRSCRPAI